LPGLIALLVALAVASAAGVALRRRQGRFRATAREALTEADLGIPLGERATLVQFSTAFCAQCRPARHVLGRVAEMVDGVSHVEIDAAARLDLVRRFQVMSTPTILVLGPDGSVTRKATGVPRTADVIAAVGAVDPSLFSRSRMYSMPLSRGVTDTPTVNSIMYVRSRPERMLLTKRRAVDFCHVATAICMRCCAASA